MRAKRFVAFYSTAALIIGLIMVACSDDDNPTTSGSQSEQFTLAGTDGGVYLSLDGSNWTATALKDTVLSLAVAGEQIYAGTNSGNVFCSSDRGGSWTSFSEGLAAREEVYALLVTSQGDLLAGLDDSGVFRALQGTESWSAANVGLPSDDCDVRSIATAPDGAILLGSQCGVFSSVDAGRSWQPTGFLDDVDRLAINEQGHLYVGTEHDGIQRSTDGGTSWTQVMASDTMIMSFAFNSVGHVFVGSGGIARSLDGGTTWTILPNSPRQAYVVTFVVLDQDHLLAGLFPFGGDSGVFRSMDNGETWVQSGLEGLGVYVLLNAEL